MGVPIAVDFDSTLTTGDHAPWWEEWTAAEPREEMIELVNELRKRHTIIIWTARPESMREETIYHLDKWGVRYHALVMGKTNVAAFIDDKAVHRDRALEMDVHGLEQFIYDDS